MNAFGLFVEVKAQEAFYFDKHGYERPAAVATATFQGGELFTITIDENGEERPDLQPFRLA